jgi:CheY-like chemotaxis protein
MQDLLRPMIRSEIDLELELAPDLQAAFLDPGQLEQVVMNLAVNAVDAMPTGGVLAIATANVELERPLPIAHGDSVGAGRWVRLSVSDTGAGMDETTAARLFDPFFTTKPPGRGTGLGLATCHGIVKQNEGLVDFETAPGRGTTFSIYFPAMQAEPTTELVPRAPRSGASLRGACVLLVEDDSLVRPALTRSLRGAGCRVLAAESPEEALRVARAHAGSIDLLISDVIMPGSTGPALREELLRERPDLRALFISGYTADVLRDREPTLSPVELLHKPFRGEELAARAALVLAQRPSGAASA